MQSFYTEEAPRSKGEFAKTGLTQPDSGLGAGDRQGTK